MGTIRVKAERDIATAPELLYDYIADNREHHPNFLPEAFSNFQVESGGIGAGTITRFRITAGGRSREYRMVVAEPEPGSVLTESDSGSTLVTTFTVSPHAGGARVQIATTWEGAGGVGGFFERLFAPRVLRKIYEEELARLDTYAREQRA
jgi:hypothetical protein